MQPTSVMEVKLQVTLDIIHMTLLELDYQITDQITNTCKLLQHATTFGLDSARQSANSLQKINVSLQMVSKKEYHCIIRQR